MKNELIHQAILKLVDEVGYMRSDIRGIHTLQKKQNGSVSTLLGRVNDHDILFGKIKVVASISTFIVISIFGAMLAFIKDVF